MAICITLPSHANLNESSTDCSDSEIGHSGAHSGPFPAKRIFCGGSRTSSANAHSMDDTISQCGQTHTFRETKLRVQNAASYLSPSFLLVAHGCPDNKCLGPH